MVVDGRDEGSVVGGSGSSCTVSASKWRECQHSGEIYEISSRKCVIFCAPSSLTSIMSKNFRTLLCHIFVLGNPNVADHHLARLLLLSHIIETLVDL